VAPEVLPIKREPQPPSKKVQYSLNINTSPEQAKVRILNIKPAYQPSMMLNPGKYHIEVTAPDYHTKKVWINITDLPVTEQITLEPTRRLYAAGTIIIETLSDQQPGPEMVILPHISPAATPIAMGRNEIKFSEYDKFATASGRELPDDEGWGRENRPAINLSYDDALAYALWLSEETGSTYRLPTQLEWQHAARAGGSSDFWWGEESAEGKANCRSGCDSEWSKIFSSLTAPVASYSANNYGLHDTAGNVREWLGECKSWHDEQQTSCATALAAGGSHSDKLSKTTINSFQEMDAGKAYKTTGFRLVLEL